MRMLEWNALMGWIYVKSNRSNVVLNWMPCIWISLRFALITSLLPHGQLRRICFFPNLFANRSKSLFRQMSGSLLIC